MIFSMIYMGVLFHYDINDNLIFIDLHIIYNYNNFVLCIVKKFYYINFIQKSSLNVFYMWCFIYMRKRSKVNEKNSINYLV